MKFVVDKWANRRGSLSVNTILILGYDKLKYNPAVPMLLGRGLPAAARADLSYLW